MASVGKSKARGTLPSSDAPINLPISERAAMTSRSARFSRRTWKLPSRL
jgi:hypothetical protein